MCERCNKWKSMFNGKEITLVFGSIGDLIPYKSMLVQKVLCSNSALFPSYKYSPNLTLIPS